MRNASPHRNVSRPAGNRTAAEARRIRAARLRRRRRQRIKKTIILLLVLVFLAAAGCLAIFIVKGGLFARPVQAYSASREFQSALAAVEGRKAQPFAQNLCVVEGDVPLNNISLEEDQEGLLINLNENQVMYSKGAFDRVYPASITKIITALLALQYGNSDELVTITEENITLEEGSQVCGFMEGDQVSMDQLLHGLLVYSGNDAASAIAEHIGGSTEAFVEIMNRYAAKLGCTGTHFTNPHGLQDENHYTTPYDIYLMLKETLNYPAFTEITELSSYTLEYTRADGTAVATELEATDQYLTGESVPPKDVTILGGKTGTTSTAGNCLALLCQNAYGQPFVSIVMGAESKEVLYQQMNTLLMNINSGNS